MPRARITREGDRAIVPVGADFSGESVSRLRSEMREMLRDGVHDLILDFTLVQQIDAEGTALLLSARNSFLKIKGNFGVMNVSPDLLNLFQALRLHDCFPVAGI